MYIANILALLFSAYGSFGNPSVFLLPICFFAAFLLQFCLLERKQMRFHWIPAAAGGGIILALEISMHLIRSYAILFVGIALTYITVILLGILCALAVGAVFRRLSKIKV